MTKYFDISPLAFLANRPQKITIQPYGYKKTVFPINNEYTVTIFEVERSEDKRFPGNGAATLETAKVCDDGCLRFTHTFPRQGMYYVCIENIPQLRVYALNSDMAGRYPFRGDLHLHTNRSDGAEPPALVIANYREHGYDSAVISDHYRFYPSLEAREYYHIDNDDNSDLIDIYACSRYLFRISLRNKITTNSSLTKILYFFYSKSVFAMFTQFVEVHC